MEKRKETILRKLLVNDLIKWLISWFGELLILRYTLRIQILFEVQLNAKKNNDSSILEARRHLSSLFTDIFFYFCLEHVLKECPILRAVIRRGLNVNKCYCCFRRLNSCGLSSWRKNVINVQEQKKQDLLTNMSVVLK